MASSSEAQTESSCNQQQIALNCATSESVLSTEGGDVRLPHFGFYYLGTMTLLGWNMILTFTHTFDCDMLSGRTWGGSGWAFWCAMVNSALVNIVQGSLSSRKLLDIVPVGCQLVTGCLLLAVALAGMVYLKVANEGATDSTFCQALFFVSVQGTAAALMSSSVFALAGSIDKTLTMDAMIGQGIGGIIAAAVGFVAGNSPTGLVVSFVFAIALAVLGVPVYFFSIKKNQHVSERAQTSPSALNGDMLAEEGSSRSPLSANGRELVRRASSLRILQRAAWPQCLTVCFVFVVTFVVFPGVTSRWRGDHVAALIATFQIVDVIGRFSPQVDFFHVRQGKLVSLFSFLRVIFIPAFIIVERSQKDFATNAALQFILMVLFGFTNGYVSTLSMMLGPGQPGVEVDEAAPVGSMMSFFLVLGILVGSLLALLTNIGLPAAASSC